MELKYNEFELVKFDVEYINFMYELRNKLDFDNFWFFSKENISRDEFLEELKLIYSNYLVYEIYIILKNKVNIGIIFSYNFNIKVSTISISLYLKKDFRKGLNSLKPLILLLYYYKYNVKISTYIFSIYNANKFVINFFSKTVFFELVEKTAIYSDYKLTNSNLEKIFKKVKFNK